MGFQGFTPLRAEPGVLYLKSLSLSTAIFFPFYVCMIVSQNRRYSYCTIIFNLACGDSGMKPRVGTTSMYNESSSRS